MDILDTFIKIGVKDESTKQAQGIFDNIGSMAKKAATVTAAVAAGIGVAAGAIKGAVENAAAYGDNVDKMSQKIGVTAQAYQEWAYVMERAGTSVDIMQAGMKTLSTQAQENAEEFQALGISQQEVAELSKEDLFGKVIEGLSKMEDGTERTVLATKLLGKSATELGPLLNQGTDAINEQREMAERYGLVMSDAAVKASADFTDSMTTLKGAIAGAKNALMGELLPSCKTVADGITEIVTGNVDGGIELVSEGIKGTIAKISESFPSFLENGSKIVGAMIEGIAQTVPDIMDGVAQLLVKIIESIPTYLPAILSAAVSLFMGIVRAVPSVAGALLSAVGSLLSQGASAVAGFAGEMLDAGRNMIDGLIEGIAGGAGAVIQKIKSVCAGAVEAVKNFFGIHSPSTLMEGYGLNVDKGLENGIDKGAEGVVSAMEGVSRKASAAAQIKTTVSGAVSDFKGGLAAGGIVINNLVVNAEDVLTEAKFEAMLMDTYMLYA